MHSGQGDEGPDNTYRPTPLPHEPQAPSGSEPREGIVLPSKGGRWVPPSRREEQGQQWDQPAPAAPPAPGQPWGSPQQDPYGQQQPAPYDPPAADPADAQATRMMAPYDPQAGQHAQNAGAPFNAGPGQPGGGYDPSYGGLPMQDAGQPGAQPMPGADADRTQLIAPYGQQQMPGGQQQMPNAQQMPGDADRTQLLAPYGQQQMPDAQQQMPGQHGGQPMSGDDANRTQMLAPYTGHSAELVPQQPESRAPLPPEQQFNAPVPPMPQAPPPGGQQEGQQYAPPMPGGAPFAIRPGAPGDQPVAYGQDGAAPATQQLPRFQDDWQQGGGPQPSQQQQPDDYDYLYRRDDEPAQQRGPRGGAVAAFPQQQPVPQRQGGYNGPDGYGTDGYGSGGRGGVSGPRDGSRRGDQGARGRKKMSTPVLVGIGVVVLAVIGVGAGALFSGGGGSNSAQPGSSTSAAPSAGSGAADSAAQGQAKQLDALLKTSNSSRTSVINAVASIKACNNLSASAATLRAAARERDDLVTQLSGMTLTALPNNADLVGQLTAAWKASSSADNYYAAWAGQAAQPKGCKKHQAKITGAVEHGNLESGKATLAKQKAADLWNPIAKQYGLTQRQYTQL
ncbi:hypothetical protein [Streptantibioticus silvisoli]|uniref:Uncharacterized protein n=1 Tax=Streptantibioticus silvisoli TaxID=2705255 RepID=A0ABT6W480_9ACTN|nr:hypothetical protein [Streptantibioticus silvisoli]MDI5965074.1 hypothetical protein [Streptantibioticus silvisoli]